MMIKQKYTLTVLQKLTQMLGVPTYDSVDGNRAAIMTAVKNSATSKARLSDMVDQAFLEVKVDNRIQRQLPLRRDEIE